ncbi:MAG: GNAT family N-acetyltransferase [Bdellovibrionota bacterium]
MESPNLKLRIIKSNELIQIEDLLRIRMSYSNDADLASTSNRYFAELSEKDNRVFLLGFENDNSPFGYVQLILVNADNDPQLADGVQIAHIHDLRVRSDLQGKGFGRGLIKYLEEEAHLRGIKTLTLGVDNWNSRAIQFYKNLNYSEFKQEPGRTDDEFVICMQKTI